MKLFWTLQIGIGAASLAFLTAYGCGGNVVDGSTGTTTETETDTDTLGETESTTDTDTSFETDTPQTETETFTDGGTETDAFATCSCACTGFMSAGSCGDICSVLLNGATEPNFCEGLTPLAMCAACLTANCPGISQTAGTCAGM